MQRVVSAICAVPQPAVCMYVESIECKSPAQTTWQHKARPSMVVIRITHPRSYIAGSYLHGFRGSLSMSLGPPCSDDDVFRPTLQTTMSLGPPCPDDDVFRPTLFRVFHFSVYMRYSVPGYIAHTQHVCCTCGELARHAFDVHPGFFAPHRAVPSVQCRVASNTVMSRRPGAKVLVVYTDKEVLCALGPGKHYEVVLAVHRQQPFVAPVRLLVDVQFYPEHAVSERVFLDASQ
jgi:hypothetical protein